MNESEKHSDISLSNKKESNPIGNVFNVLVSIPENIEIKMVNASIFNDYEVWVFIASLLSNSVVGFWVSFATNNDNSRASLLFWISIVFSLLFLVSIAVVISKRFLMRKKTKLVKLKTSSIE
jgi:hypothetical protein